MPNLDQFKSKEERNAWYRTYRKTRKRELRKYNRERMRRLRASSAA
jgi:hypothetical protein